MCVMKSLVRCPRRPAFLHRDRAGNIRRRLFFELLKFVAQGCQPLTEIVRQGLIPLRWVQSKRALRGNQFLIEVPHLLHVIRLFIRRAPTVDEFDFNARASLVIQRKAINSQLRQFPLEPGT